MSAAEATQANLLINRVHDSPISACLDQIGFKLNKDTIIRARYDRPGDDVRYITKDCTLNYDRVDKYMRLPLSFGSKVVVHLCFRASALMIPSSKQNSQLVHLQGYKFVFKATPTTAKEGTSHQLRNSVSALVQTASSRVSKTTSQVRDRGSSTESKAKDFVAACDGLWLEIDREEYYNLVELRKLQHGETLSDVETRNLAELFEHCTKHLTAFINNSIPEDCLTDVGRNARGQDLASVQQKQADLENMPLRDRLEKQKEIVANLKKMAGSGILTMMRALDVEQTQFAKREFKAKIAKSPKHLEATKEKGKAKRKRKESGSEGPGPQDDIKPSGENVETSSSNIVKKGLVHQAEFESSGDEAADHEVCGRCTKRERPEKMLRCDGKGCQTKFICFDCFRGSKKVMPGDLKKRYATPNFFCWECVEKKLHSKTSKAVLELKSQPEPKRKTQAIATSKKAGRPSTKRSKHIKKEHMEGQE